MSRCPVCEDWRIVIVVAPGRRAFCVRCGARWEQEGSLQRRIRRRGTQSSEVLGVESRT